MILVALSFSIPPPLTLMTLNSKFLVCLPQYLCGLLLHYSFPCSSVLLKVLHDDIFCSHSSKLPDDISYHLHADGFQLDVFSPDFLLFRSQCPSLLKMFIESLNSAYPILKLSSSKYLADFQSQLKFVPVLNFNKCNGRNREVSLWD